MDPFWIWIILTVIGVGAVVWLKVGIDTQGPLPPDSQLPPQMRNRRGKWL